MGKRIINFNPGPCALPLEILEKAAAEFTDYAGTGMSIMEISHRSKQFQAVVDEAVALLKELLSVPDNYKIMFLGGGASSQFYFVPMNYLGGGVADYVNTGSWSKKAIKEAKLFGTVNVAASSEDDKFKFIPKQADLKLTADAKYVHYTSNNTIYGTEFHYVPAVTPPLICDMSSDIMSFPLDVGKFALIYAGAQKNLGPAGVTVIIARDDFIEQGSDKIPTMVQYRTHAKENSLYNTPPCVNIYMLKLFMEWVKKEGGLKGMAARTDEKAKLLYGAVDEMGALYKGHAAADSRSNMNATFNLAGGEEQEKKFIEEATKAGFGGCKGHRSVGGIRISMYNAISPEDIKKLVAFMKEFYTKSK